MMFPPLRSTKFAPITSSDFEEDAEFQKLITHAQNVNLTKLFLELARDRQPEIDFTETESWISERATELKSTGIQISRGEEQLKKLADNLCGEHGLYGHPGHEESPTSHDLNCTIEAKCGSPVALALLFLAVASELGLEMQLLALSPRILIRFESVEETLFLDPFDSGAVRTFAETANWLQTSAGYSQAEAETKLDQHPISPRNLVLQTLDCQKHSLNAKHQAVQRWKVQSRLVALKPACYVERRDLGLAALQASRPGLAVCILQECLKVCPDTESKMLAEALEQARNQVAQWN